MNKNTIQWYNLKFKFFFIYMDGNDKFQFYQCWNIFILNLYFTIYIGIVYKYKVYQWWTTCLPNIPNTFSGKDHRKELGKKLDTSKLIS